MPRARKARKPVVKEVERPAPKRIGLRDVDEVVSGVKLSLIMRMQADPVYVHELAADGLRDLAEALKALKNTGGKRGPMLAAARDMVHRAVFMYVSCQHRGW
jgi:hypothetical protein